MRVIYYAASAVLEHVPMEVEVLSQEVELITCIEISPERWESNLLDLPDPEMKPGVYEGKAFLQSNLPSEVWNRFEKSSQIYLIVYPQIKSLGNLQVLYQFKNLVSKLKPDILNFNGETIREALASLLLKCPIVLNVHEPLVQKNEGNFRSGIAKGILHKRASHFIAHSKECKNLLVSVKKVEERNITIAPMGPMHAIRAWAKGVEPADKEQNILYIGRIHPRKGIDNLIEAVKELSKEYGNINLIIAGKPADGIQPPESQTLKNNGRITIVPHFLSNSELASYVSSCSFMVLPYVDARQSSVVLTAYAFGKPVIATAVGGLIEQVTHEKTGLLVPPSDVSSLKDAIKQMIIDRTLREKIEFYIKSSADPFLSWNKYKEKTLGVFKNLRTKAKSDFV